MVFDTVHQKFTVRQGPIFAQIVLADEVNRAPAKVQSALLEAMQERQVTIGGTSYQLPQPFLVLATQNPIESEGTYPLPEAQLDRFLLKVRVDYPTRTEEREVLQRMSAVGESIPVRRLADPAQVLAARSEIHAIHLDARLADYIVDLVRASREPASVGLGELAADDRLRRFTARVDRPGADGACPCLPPGARLRHTRGRAVARARRHAAPDRPDVRRGSRGDRHRLGHPAAARRRAGAVTWSADFRLRC